MFEGSLNVRPESETRARRLRKAFSAPAPDAPFGALASFTLSVWLGLVVGLIELGLTIIQKPLHDPSPGFFRMNRHILWTIPTVDLVVFGLLGLFLALGSRIWPRRHVRLSALLLVGMAVVTLLLSSRKLHHLAALILACGLSYRLARRAEANLPAIRRMVRRTLPALAFGVLGLVSLALGRHIVREPWAMASVPAIPFNGPAAPNVLLIVMDTTRADRLSLYGYGRDTTPNLKKLARRGITFDRARSTAPWTLPSHASMMTGHWPHQLSARLHGPLDEAHPTLAQFLAANGYATAGFIANTSYCSAETGLDRGFAHYEDHDLSPPALLRTSALGQRVLWPLLVSVNNGLGGDLKPEPTKDAARISRDLLAWTATADRSRPFFAFLNYIDAHTPYFPPEGFHRFFGLRAESPADLRTIDQWFTSDKDKLSPRDFQLASDAYDDCIAFIDEQIGRLLEGLDRQGRLEQTLIVVTADHGEHFGEHKLFGHASSLYDQEIHVPLVIVPPGAAGKAKVVAEPVSLRDLAATVVDLIGLGNDSPFPGRSLARDRNTAEGQEPEAILSEVDGPAKSTPNLGRSPAFRGPMQAVAIGNEVYIRRADGVEELYDLATDPAQARNLIDSPTVLPRLDAFRATRALLTCDDLRPDSWRNTAGPRHQLGRTIDPAKLPR